MFEFYKQHQGWCLFYLVCLVVIFFLVHQKLSPLHNQQGINTPIEKQSEEEKMADSNDPWKEKLTSEQYTILREKGTEIPYTSELLHEKRAGTYYAVDTHEPVFRSEDKFDSGTGWPSFTRPIKPDAVQEAKDTEYGMTRTEILSTAGGHLGHVFPDGPEPTGLRYCMNGAVLYFVPDAK